MTLYNIQSGISYTLLVHAGDDPGIIVNRDAADVIYLGTHPGFNLVSEASLLDPTTFVQYSGETDIYGICLPGSTAIADVMPQMQNWSPSPAMSAAALLASGISTAANQVSQSSDIPNNLFALGVPLANKSQTVQSIPGQIVAAGATFTAPQVPVNAPTFEVYMVLNNASAADATPQIRFIMNWVDSSSGAQIYTGKYNFVPGCGAGINAIYHGIGVSHGDQLQVQVINQGSSALTVTYIVLQNGKANPISNELWTQVNSFTYPASLYVAGGVDPNANVLLNSQANVGTGATLNRMVLPYYGRPIQLSFHTASGNADAYVRFEAPTALIPLGPFNSPEIYRAEANGNGDIFNATITMPNFPMVCRMVNNNAALQQFDVNICGI